MLAGLHSRWQSSRPAWLALLLLLSLVLERLLQRLLGYGMQQLSAANGPVVVDGIQLSIFLPCFALAALLLRHRPAWASHL